MLDYSTVAEIARFEVVPKFDSLYSETSSRPRQAGNLLYTNLCISKSLQIGHSIITIQYACYYLPVASAALQRGISADV